MKIRIGLAVDPFGKWIAYGFDLKNPPDHPGELVGDLLDSLHDGERYYWVEAEIPDPVGVETIAGEVTEP